MAGVHNPGEKPRARINCPFRAKPGLKFRSNFIPGEKPRARINCPFRAKPGLKFRSNLSRGKNSGPE